MNTDAEEEPARKGDGAEEPHHPAHRCTDTDPHSLMLGHSPHPWNLLHSIQLSKNYKKKKRFGCVSHGFPTHLDRFLRARFLKD